MTPSAARRLDLAVVGGRARGASLGEPAAAVDEEADRPLSAPPAPSSWRERRPAQGARAGAEAASILAACRNKAWRQLASLSFIGIFCRRARRPPGEARSSEKHHRGAISACATMRRLIARIAVNKCIWAPPLPARRARHASHLGSCISSFLACRCAPEARHAVRT